MMAFVGAALVIILILVGVALGIAFLVLLDIWLLKLIFQRDPKPSLPELPDLPELPFMVPMVEDAWHTPLPLHHPSGENVVTGTSVPHQSSSGSD